MGINTVPIIMRDKYGVDYYVKISIVKIIGGYMFWCKYYKIKRYLNEDYLLKIYFSIKEMF